MNAVQATARRAGALYFVFMLTGLVDMYGFTGFVVPGDATATAGRIVAAGLTYRLGILTDLVTLVLFIFLVVGLYNLLKDAGRWHATLMVALVSVGVTVGLANLFNKIAPLILLSGAGYLSVFSKPQLNALALGFSGLNDYGDYVAAVFWGLWLFPFGILVIKSGFVPRILGILLLVAGVGNLTGSVTSIVLPALSHVVTRVTGPLALGEFPIIFWLLIKGATAPRPEPST